jgi:Ca2+-binding RTX toxin-like protein
VSFASITSDTLQLGSGTVDMNFISPRALTATGGSGTDTITANSGNNRFVAGTGALTVTGGSGHNSFVFHADDGSLTITDFSHRRDTLTVDQSLKGSFQEASDGNGGTLITFGTAGHGIDLAHVSYRPKSLILNCSTFPASA